MTLPAFIDEEGHHIVAFFAFLWPSSVGPAHMVALMVFAQVSCDPLNPLLSIAFLLFLDFSLQPLPYFQAWSMLSSFALLVDMIASINLNSTLEESVLYPVLATTSLPAGTAYITEFEPATATVPDVSYVETAMRADSRHMMTAHIQLDHSPTVLAPLPALFSSQLDDLLELFIVRAIPVVRGSFACNARLPPTLAAGCCRARIIGRRDKNGAAGVMTICSVRRGKLDSLLTEFANYIGIEEHLAPIEGYRLPAASGRE